MRHYISIAVFGTAFGFATAMTILVLGKAMSPAPAAMIQAQPPIQAKLMAWDDAQPWHWHYHYHWHGHDLENAIRARVAAELEHAFDSLDVDSDNDDDAAPPAPAIPVVPVVTVH